MSAAPQPIARAPWWAGFFDDDFATLWLQDDDPSERARRTDGLLRVLELRAGQRLFDQCCGVGRVAVPVLARGVHVEAVDCASAYVSRARERCGALPLATRGDFHVALADAFEYRPTRACDAAINWYTSFGYVADDARNLMMLRAAYAALRPLGLFALDYPDMERVRAEFRPCTERRRETPHGTLVAVREAWLDEAREMLVDRWTFTSPRGEVRVSEGETRLFSREQLRDLLRRAGFGVLRRVAPEEVGYPPDAGRCIWLARRPAREQGDAS